VDLQDYYFERNETEHMRKVDDEFHDQICLLSKRTVIMDTLIPLHRKTRRYRRLAMEDKVRTQITRKEHRAIYEAIITGNAELAAALTSEHIKNAKAHMLGGMK